MIYDLHSHSTASDGMLTPTELILRAVEQKVDVLALTDHDTLAGIQEAKIAAESQPIQLISGVEISALWQNKNIHLTALDIDEHHPALIELRAHYARFLVQQDYVRNIEHAFKKYLGTGKIAYVKPQWSSISHVIDVTHQAGGVICLAHPLRYKMTARWLRALIEHFKQAGGDGIEVASCGQRPDQRQLIARWASEFDLYASVGSDFHYPTGWIELGKSLTLPTTCKPIWQLFTTQ